MINDLKGEVKAHRHHQFAIGQCNDSFCKIKIQNFILNRIVLLIQYIEYKFNDASIEHSII